MPQAVGRIAKIGYSARTPPTEGTVKNFVALDTVENHKLVFSGWVTSGSYTHNLGKKPTFFAFESDSVTAPTYFSLMLLGAANTTQIINLPNPTYLLVFQEGA